MQVREASTTARLMNYQNILKAHIEYYFELLSRDVSNISIEKLLRLCMESEDRLIKLMPACLCGDQFPE